MDGGLARNAEHGKMRSDRVGHVAHRQGMMMSRARARKKVASLMSDGNDLLIEALAEPCRRSLGAFGDASQRIVDFLRL
jgi:hypothetical protein